MMELLRVFRVVAACVLIGGYVVPVAIAADGKTPTGNPGGNGKRGVPIEQFGKGNPVCQQWSDGCQICLRAGGKIHCTTPGIACLRTTAVCMAVKWIQPPVVPQPKPLTR